MSSAAADEPPAAPAATSPAAPVAEGETPAAPDGPAPTEGPAVAPLPPPDAAPTPVPAPPPSAAAPEPVDAPLNTPPPARPAGELLPWAGTVLGWGHAVSASLLGINTGTGAFVYKDGGSYSQTLALSGGYFILRRPPHQLRVSTSLVVDVQAAGGDTALRQDPVDLRDIPLQLEYIPTLWSTGSGGPVKGQAAMYAPTLLGTGDHRTWGFVGGSLSFPTSRYSQGTRRLLSTSLWAGARQQIKLLGSEAPGLTHLVLSFTETWSHHFHEASTPIDDDLQLPRQDFQGNAQVDNQIRGTVSIENRLVHSFALLLPLYANLQLGSSFRLINDFPFQLTKGGCNLQTGTSCVDLDVPTKMRAATSFSAWLSYLIVPELAVALGYSNTADQLGADGKYRNPLASPYSLFYTEFSFSFDRLYQRFTQPESLRAQLAGPPRAEPAPAAP